MVHLLELNATRITQDFHKTQNSSEYNFIYIGKARLFDDVI